MFRIDEYKNRYAISQIHEASRMKMLKAITGGERDAKNY